MSSTEQLQVGFQRGLREVQRKVIVQGDLEVTCLRRADQVGGIFMEDTVCTPTKIPLSGMHGLSVEATAVVQYSRRKHGFSCCWAEE